MNPTYIFLLIGSLIAACGASTVSEEVQSKDVTVDTSTIDNAIQNMLNGDSTPGDVKYLIRVEYRSTLHDADYSQEEIELNKKYQEYLQAAYNVAEAKALNSMDLQDKIEIMNEKRVTLS